MITLGVTADGGAHAAVVKDGALVSAVSGATDVVACIDEALAVASIEWRAVDRILVTGRDAVSRLDGRGELVGRLQAHAAQLRAISPAADIVVMVNDSADDQLSAMNAESPSDVDPVRPPHALLEAVTSVARALGTSTLRPIAALESIAMFESASGTRRAEGEELSLDKTAIEAMLAMPAAQD